jgi:putative phosphoesterase
VKVAVLADVHGNLPALRAVLADVEGDGVEAIVVAGDVVGGPYPREALDVLARVPVDVTWIRGNCEREAVAAWDGAPTATDEAGRAAEWSARALDRAWRDRLDAWPLTVALDGVRYCHASPRRDDEILTQATPEAAIREAIGDVREAMVVGGHTHQQLIRELDGGLTYVNAGSVGIPYEGRPGAFWLIVDDGQPRLRETSYDVTAAVEELRASGFADVESQVEASLLEPVDPAWVSAFFEHAAGRGADPGPPPGSHVD